MPPRRCPTVILKVSGSSFVARFEDGTAFNQSPDSSGDIIQNSIAKILNPFTSTRGGEWSGP